MLVINGLETAGGTVDVNGTGPVTMPGGSVWLFPMATEITISGVATNVSDTWFTSHTFILAADGWHHGEHGNFGEYFLDGFYVAIPFVILFVAILAIKRGLKLVGSSED